MINEIYSLAPGTVFFSSELSESRLLGEVRFGVFFVFSVLCGGVLKRGRNLSIQAENSLIGNSIGEENSFVRKALCKN